MSLFRCETVISCFVVGARGVIYSSRVVKICSILFSVRILLRIPFVITQEGNLETGREMQVVHGEIFIRLSLASLYSWYFRGFGLEFCHYEHTEFMDIVTQDEHDK